MNDFKNNIHIQNITLILKQVGERVEGNLICDGEPENWVYNENFAKIHNVQLLCKHKKKIIEIGINACHSLVLMLMVNPTATYLLFDLNNHKYTEKCLDYVRNAFPSSNINVIFGDSTITIPKYISLHSDEINTYEMCHLDGGHTEDIFSKDYENTKILLNENGIVIFDDFDMEPIYNYINRKIHDKEIYIEDDKNIIKNSKHCIYRYANEQSSGLEYFHVFLFFLSCFIIIFFAFGFYRSRKQSL